MDRAPLVRGNLLRATYDNPTGNPSGGNGSGSGGCCTPVNGNGDPCDIDLTKVPAGGVFTVQAGTLSAVDISQVIFQIPSTQHFYMMFAFLASDNVDAPPPTAGLDFVPQGFPTSKQTVGAGVPPQTHVEGIYLINTNNELGWSVNQTCIFKGNPILIPAGSSIRIVRPSISGGTGKMFGKVAGYLIDARCQIKAKIIPTPKPPGGYEPKSY